MSARDGTIGRESLITEGNLCSLRLESQSAYLGVIRPSIEHTKAARVAKTGGIAWGDRKSGVCRESGSFGG